MSENFKMLVLLLVFLGFISTGVAQQVIITTTTTIVTIPGKTYTTTLTGGGSTMIMVVPEYTMIIVEKRPDKTCTIVVKPLESSGVIAIPGTTIIVPGTTIQTVITEPTIKHATTIREDGITTTTEYTHIEFATTMYGQTFSMPLLIYAEIIQRCETIQVIEEVTIIMGKVPATFYYAIPGMTYPFGGTTYTMGETVEVPLTPFTTVKIMHGTTYTERTVFPGATETTTVVLPSTVATITEPRRIVTSTITYVVTAKSSPEQTISTTTLTTLATLTTTTTTSPTASPRTETMKTVEGLGLPLDIIIMIAIIATILIVTIVILLLRKK